MFIFHLYKFAKGGTSCVLGPWRPFQDRDKHRAINSKTTMTGGSWKKMSLHVSFVLDSLAKHEMSLVNR